jgi:hypothetical protein
MSGSYRRRYLVTPLDELGLIGDLRCWAALACPVLCPRTRPRSVNLSRGVCELGLGAHRGDGPPTNSIACCAGLKRNRRSEGWRSSRFSKSVLRLVDEVADIAVGVLVVAGVVAPEVAALALPEGVGRQRTPPRHATWSMLSMKLLPVSSLPFAEGRKVMPTSLYAMVLRVNSPGLAQVKGEPSM